MAIEYDTLLEQVESHDFWKSYLSDALPATSGIGIHLAIFAEPFLSMILSGEKTVESRFSRNRCAPYGEIGEGDIILVKAVGGAVLGIALAKHVWCYDLAFEPIDRIRDRFGADICANEAFWSSRSDALYATLIEIDAPTEIDPMNSNKRDRRGWVTLRNWQLGFDFP